VTFCRDNRRKALSIVLFTSAPSRLRVSCDGLPNFPWNRTLDTANYSLQDPDSEFRVLSGLS